MHQNQVAVGIGTNLGNRLSNIQIALQQLRRVFGPLQISSVVESDALLKVGSPERWNRPYLNAVAAFSSPLPPEAIFKNLQEIEQIVGPRIEGEWAPRTMDLDLLIYGDEVTRSEGLEIPHRELVHRPFSLFPLSQVLPYWQHPVLRKTALELIGEQKPSFTRILSAKPYLVGILNITPDSFSDGGMYMEPDKALKLAEMMDVEGASYVELGAAPTNKMSRRITHEEEWARLAPVLGLLKKRLPHLRLGLDTYNEETALRASGIDLFNFIGKELPLNLIETLVDTPKRLVVTHTKSISHDQSLTPLLEQWCEEMVSTLESLGLSREQILLDPGIGFGKSPLQNLEIIQHLGKLTNFGCSLFVGHSRKSFLRPFSKHRLENRDAESAHLTQKLQRIGVDYFRVHDIETHMQALNLGGNLAIA